MRNIIQLLPDAVAQRLPLAGSLRRPASVVKELLENAIDAGADRIDLMVKNTGKNDHGNGQWSGHVGVRYSHGL